MNKAICIGRRPSLPRAFTLVELLVVLGIIAVLIAIIMPALNKARASARSAVCLSNLRTIGHGFLMYANDNHDQLVWPQIKEGSVSKYYWWDLIGPYLGTKDLSTPQVVKSCPDYAPPTTGLQSYHKGYGMNTKAKMYVDNGGTARETAEYKHPSDGYLDASGNWKSPAHETAYRNLKMPWKYSRVFSRPTDKYIVGDANSMKCEPISSNITEWLGPPPYTGGAPVRHNLGKTANYLFLDGHAETRIPSHAHEGYFVRK